MGARFVAAPFRWNLRLAIALLPSLAIVASFGGLPAVFVLTAGAIIAYVLDALRQKEAAFAAVWITLGGMNMTLLFTGAVFPYGRPVVLSVIMTAVNALTLLLAGLWATLQFKFLQLQYPSLMLAFERVLLGCAMPLGSAIQTWGVVAAVGASHAAFYLAALLGVMYFALATPLPSSFRKAELVGPAIGGGRADAGKDARVQRRLDGLVNAALFACVPVWFYIAVHWAALFKWEHFWSVLVLASGPWCCMAIAPEGLWWLSGKPERRQAMRVVVSVPAAAVCLAGVEGRLVLPAFGEYIRLHPPFNYIAVTAALYGVAFLVLLHTSGSISDWMASTLDGAALMVAAGAGSLAVGVPLAVMPAPLLAAGGMAMFLDSNAMRDYVLFVAGSLGTAVWFVYHHFWFLDVSIGGLPLQAVCQLLIVALIPAALLPGLLSTGAAKDFINQQMLLQGILVFVVEEVLYSGDHPTMQSAAYPAFLVVLTTALGAALTEHLAAAGKLGVLTRWWCHCMYWSKLAMLVVPEARLGVPMLVLVQASTPPLLLAGPLGHKKLESWRGILHSFNVVLAVMLSRFAIFDIVAFLSGGRPAEGLVTGALLVAIAVGCMPLVSKFFSATLGPPRALAMVLSAGVLLMTLRPPLPLKGGSRCPRLPLALCPRLWDDTHIPARDEDDAAYYALGLARRLDWPLWLLFGGGLTALGAMATPTTYRGAFSGSRLVLASAAGVAVGAYVALEFFPDQPLLQAVILMGACIEGALLTMLQLPGAASPVWLPALAAAWALQMPVALALANSAELPELPVEARRLFPDPTHAMDIDRSETERAAVLAVCAAEALLLAFALKLRVAGAAHSPDRSDRRSSRSKGSGLGVGAAGYVGTGYRERASDFLGACLPLPSAGSSLSSLSRIKGSAGPGMVALIQEGLGWVPTACNVATSLALLAALLLNSHMTDSSDASIFALAPILLLLTQDPLVLWGLQDRRRYLPPAVAVTTFLTLSAASQLIADFSAGADSLLDEHAREVLYNLRNWGTLAAGLPCHVLFAQYAWNRTKASATVLVSVLLAAAGSLIFTDMQTIQTLAASGMLMSGVQFFAMRRVSEVGRKLI